MTHERWAFLRVAAVLLLGSFMGVFRASATTADIADLLEFRGGTTALKGARGQ